MLESIDLVKYLLEGAAVAAAAFYLPQKKTNLQDVLMIAAVAAATFLLLDQFAPAVSAGARQGSGFGIGASMVGGYYDDALAAQQQQLAGMQQQQQQQ
jgi:hypothetical protein